MAPLGSFNDVDAEGVVATVVVCPTFNEDRVDDFVPLLFDRAQIGGGGGRGAMRESAAAAAAELGPEDNIPAPETFAGVVALLNDVLIMSPAFFLIVLTPPK